MNSEFCKSINFNNIDVLYWKDTTCDIHYKNGNVIKVLDDDFRTCFEMPAIVKDNNKTKTKNKK